MIFFSRSLLLLSCTSVLSAILYTFSEIQHHTFLAISAGEFNSYLTTMYDLKADAGLAVFDGHLKDFAYASG